MLDHGEEGRELQTSYMTVWINARGSDACHIGFSLTSEPGNPGL